MAVKKTQPRDIISRIDMTARSGADRVVVFIYKSAESLMFKPDYERLYKLRDFFATQNIEIAVSPLAISVIWKIEDNADVPETEEILAAMEEEMDEA